ncbi:MAG: NAD(P)H-dependent glycerol-3-phosphate dehydrogenase [Usitatibacter sp.]
MAQVGIIGGGAFGTAMACVVRRSGHAVTLWAREPEVVAGIEAEGTNASFLPGVRLVAGIRATNDLAEVTRASDFILMAVPAQHMRTIAGAMRPALRRATPVVSCSKGIERESAALMPEVLADMLPEAVVAVLSGPSFAREIAVDLPCGVALACGDWSVGESLAREISNPRFCVHLSDDVAGTAIAGAMKNVISIASGVAHGRKLGENARATLITLGLAEAERLGIVKGARAETFVGLAGAGDFMLTAHSLQSRNTSLGVALGEGRRLADILAERKEVTEGAFSVEAAAMLARRLHVEMPITHALDGLLNRGVALEAAIADLMKHLPPLWRAGRGRPAPA